MTTTILLGCVADAQLRSPDKGAGTGATIAIGDIASETQRAVLRFAMPDWAALGAKAIVSATLQWRNQSPIGSNPAVIVRRNTTSWSEGTQAVSSTANAVRWNNKPSTTATGEASSGTLSDTDDAWVDVADVTTIVRAWAPATVQSGLGQPNYGVTVLTNDEANAARNAGFSSRETSSDPRIKLVYATNLAPLAPTNLVPGIQSTGDPVVAFYLTGSARNDPGVAYQAASRYLRFGATRHDPDEGDYITGMVVEIYANSATDGTPGSVIHSKRRLYTGKPTSVTDDVNVDTLTTGTTYRARIQTSDKDGLWGAWSSLTKIRFKPDTKPVLTNPSASVDSARPTFSGSLSDPDAGASISAAYIRVYNDTALGVITMWDSGWVDVAGGTRFAVAYGGSQDLAFGTKYRYEMALKDNVGGASAFVTGLHLTPKAVTGPDAMSPIDVDTKQDSITPTLTVGHSSAFDAYELEVGTYSDGSGLLWDVPPTTHTSTTSKAVVYAGTVLAWGQTYYWRAKVRIGGTTWSEWSPWYPFYVNALPSQPVITIDNAVDSGDGAFGPYVSIDDDTPVLRLPFVDPDLVRGYTDTPTRREIEIVDADTLLGVSGSPFVITSAIGSTYTPGGGVLSYEATYKARVRFDDSAGQRSQWSEWLVFKPSQAPTITAGTAPSTDDPTALIDWTYSSPAGKTQKAYEAFVYDAATGELVWASGYVLSADSFTHVPGYTLENGTDYTWDVVVYDSDNLSDSLTAAYTWSASFSVPADFIGSITATPDEGTASILLEWNSWPGDAEDFWRYFVYRRDPTSGLFVKIGEVAEQVNPTYTDSEAPHGQLSEYRVTVSNGWAENENALTASATLDLLWWLVTPGDPSLTFELRWWQDYDDSVDPQQEAFVPLGRTNPVVVSGEQLGPEGTVTLLLTPDEAPLVALVARAAKVDPYVILKSQFGEVLRVKIGAVSRTRGEVGMQTLKIPYRTVSG